MFYAFTLALGIILGGSSAFAQAVCYEPIAPFRMEPSTNFGSDAVRGRCESDIADYVDKLDTYMTCLQGKIETAQGEKEGALERAREIRETIE